MILVLKDSVCFPRLEKVALTTPKTSIDARYDRNLSSILFVIKLTNHTVTLLFTASHPL